MYIEPFAVEMWMNEWETKCDLNLAETCVASITIGELLELSGKNSDDLSQLLAMKMGYGDIKGSPRLLTVISALYEKQGDENLVVTHGTIGANMLVHKTLVSRGDKVVAVVPTYQQHYSIPASIGADVVPLRLRVENKYLPDLDELRRLVTPDTRMIAINNPNNPTGALIERPMLEDIAEIARQADAYVLSDEVYRGLNQTGDGMTPSMADVYEKGISTCSTSKAFSLAGLRLGWIAAPAEVIEDVMLHRDYDTIAVGRLDDHFAAMALENAPRLLARSHQITRSNLERLAAWVDNEPRITWVKPRSGTTTLLTYDADIPSREFCVRLLQDTGVMFTPGSAFGEEGTVRIGFANDPKVLEVGLPKVSAFLANL